MAVPVPSGSTARRTAAAAWRMASHSRSAVDAAGRGLVVVAGGVEADDGVEVDDAAGLVLGDLDVADPQPGRGAVSG